LPELQVVDNVDLNRYLGKWYEIASIPAWFQRGCASRTTATYTLNKDGTIGVLNECYDKNGEMKKANGRAWVVDKKTNAKLKVSFLSFLGLRLFAADYWIIDLGSDYEYAVVGHPSRTFGWILSRNPTLPDVTFDGIVRRLTAKGYDFSKFKMTDQTDSKRASY